MFQKHIPKTCNVFNKYMQFKTKSEIFPKTIESDSSQK